MFTILQLTLGGRCKARDGQDKLKSRLSFGRLSNLRNMFLLALGLGLFLIEQIVQSQYADYVILLMLFKPFPIIKIVGTNHL